MLLEIFNQWFSGCWNNQKQAYSNPRGQAYVHVIHELRGDEYECSYRHRRQRLPYRYFSAKVFHNDGVIVLMNPTHDITFRRDCAGFVSNERFTKNGVLYINEAHLGENHYHVKDQGFRINTGEQLWGLPDDQFYEFDRT